MRTTLNLDEALLRDAARATGIDEKTRLVHLGLQKLIQEAAARRLATLHGTIRRASAPRRRKFH